MNLPPELEEVYPALRLVTAGYITMADLDDMTIDDVDDLTIVISAEADAMRRQHKKRGNR